MQIYALAIPFVESFRHSLHERSGSDAVVVRVVDDQGNDGFGEGLPREYVTGETRADVLRRCTEIFWPAVRDRELGADCNLATIDAFLPDISEPHLVSDGAARSAMSLAIVDCMLHRNKKSLGELIVPLSDTVTYSGVVTASSVEHAVRSVEHFTQVGIRSLKVKVGFADDEPRLRAIRDAAGVHCAIRIDANGAWSLEQAATILQRFAPLGIASVEQPIARGDIRNMVELRRISPIPIMADESLVTIADAQLLADAKAVDIFNVRISKCGGLYRSLRIAEIARQSGIDVQIGCQVGETAILSAAGRALSAGTAKVVCNEGSFGTLLLMEDLCTDAVRFGFRGIAPILRGYGLGVHVRLDRLEKYAVETITA